MKPASEQSVRSELKPQSSALNVVAMVVLQVHHLKPAIFVAVEVRFAISMLSAKPLKLNVNDLPISPDPSEMASAMAGVAVNIRLAARAGNSLAVMVMSIPQRNG